LLTDWRQTDTEKSSIADLNGSIWRNSLTTLENNDPSLAVLSQTYLRIMRQNKIGEIREFWSLKNISEYFTYQFLEQRHLVKYVDQDTLVKLMIQNLFKDEYSISRYYQIWNEICIQSFQLLTNDANF